MRVLLCHSLVVNFNKSAEISVQRYCFFRKYAKLFRKNPQQLSNCRRKRTSFSENRRKSFTRYFRLVIRSTPNPKA